jgi:HAD superfamily hydrolase (TIGR01490 family)
MQTELAIFDLDNTLLNGDSDYLWGQFLTEQHLVDGEAYERENKRFYEDYRKGALDMKAYLAFQLRFLSLHELTALQQWHGEFMEQVIRPILLPQATALLDSHRQAGRTLLIITATNRFVTEPIARQLGVEHLLATELEMANGRYTGRPKGIPCFQNGKVTRLQEWLAKQGGTLGATWFYSDSHNDLPLLHWVDHPVAVDPDEILRQQAQAKGWPIISLRELPRT